MYKKIVLLSVLLVQAQYARGMESLDLLKDVLPKEVWPLIVNYVVWPKERKSFVVNTGQSSKASGSTWADALWSRAKSNLYLQEVSKNFRRMFWDSFTLEERDEMVGLLTRKQPIDIIDRLPDITVSMQARLYPAVYYSIQYRNDDDSGNSLKLVRMLLKNEKIDLIINDTCGFPWTLLGVAVLHNRLEIAKVLLSCPTIDVNYKAPLYWAVHDGHVEMAQLLLAHPQIDVNTVEVYHDEQTALFAAIGLSYYSDLSKLRSVLDLLVKAGIDSTIKNKNGETALDVAREKLGIWHKEAFELFEQLFTAKNNV